MSSGRPATPTQWATVSVFPGTYSPATPWMGQPLKLAPITGYFDPGTALPPAAEELNFMFWQTSQDVLGLSAQSGTPDGSNWPHGQLAWTGSQFVVQGGTAFTGIAGPPVYSAASGVWLLSVAGTNTYAGSGLYQSADGRSWSFTGFSYYSATGSPTGNYQAVPRSTDGHLLLTPNAGGMYTVVFNPFTSTAGANQSCAMTAPAADCWVSGAWFNSMWVIWSGGASSSNAPYYSASDTASFTAAGTWAPPSGFVINNLAHIVSPTVILLFPSGTSVVSEYMLTATGTSWVPVAMPTLTTGEGVIDATYDAVSGLYYMLTGTSTACRVWQSSTGAAGSWTVVSPTVGSTSGFIGHKGYALKANGTELLAIIAFGGVTRGIMSTTGGTSWVLTPLMDTSAPGNYFSLKSNGSQFIYTNTNTYSLGLCGRCNAGVGFLMLLRCIALSLALSGCTVSIEPQVKVNVTMCLQVNPTGKVSLVECDAGSTASVLDDSRDE